MNKKAEEFKNYLAEKEITCFKEEDINDDQLNTVAFRSFIEIDGQQLPTVLIFDSSIYSMIRIQVASKALKEENEVNLLKRINEINSKYKVFKYYLDENGNLLLDCCIVNKDGEVDGDMIYTILNVIIQHLSNEYKNTMKVIWG